MEQFVFLVLTMAAGVASGVLWNPFGAVVSLAFWLVVTGCEELYTWGMRQEAVFQVPAPMVLIELEEPEELEQESSTSGS